MFRAKFLFIIFIVACASPRPRTVPRPAALGVRLDSFGDSTLGVGCLPAGKDSNEFSLAIIVDSPSAVAGSVTISLADRPSAQNARNPNVSATLYRSGSGEVVGSGCSKSGGVVFRATPTVLRE